MVGTSAESMEGGHDHLIIASIRRLIGSLAAIYVAVLLSGCTFSDSLRHDEVRSVWTTGAPARTGIFFITDRDAEGDTFGLHWGADLHCGRAQVVIPSATSIQEAPEPVLQPLACATSAQVSDFAGLVRAEAQSRNCDSLLLIIPGYNTTFRTALLRGSQAAADTQWPCATLVFSWSSEGKFDRYVADIERGEYAVQPLISLLRALNDHGLRVNLFSQSMGSRIALRALSETCRPADRLVNELVLAAPDIGAEQYNDDFGRFLKRDAPCAQRVTIYASDYDTALITSESVHGGIPRAGRLPIDDLQYIGGEYGNNIDLVDASVAPDDAVGHGYFFLSHEMLKDLMWVFAGQPIERRAAANEPAEQSVICYPPTAGECQGNRYVLNVTAERRPEWTRRLLRIVWPLLSPIE